VAAQDGAVSYAELEASARRTARQLAALGVGAGDRVATTLPPGIGFVRLLHALPKLGAALVPLSARATAAERRFQVEDAGARLVVDQPLDGVEAEASLREHVEPGETHSIVYTSGTTGRPKGVALSYGNHQASADASAENLGVEPDDRWLCVLPLHHVGGLAILLRSAIYATAVEVHQAFDAELVAARLASGEITLASLVPTMLRRLQAVGFEPSPRLRAVLLGGGPSPPDLLGWAAERGLPVVPTYGMTETASQIATARGGEAAARPLRGVELRIEDGEILVRGPMVAAGALAADGWLHTGDRGRLEADGSVLVEGRLDELIVTGGENVAAAEVEAALLSHPAVADAAVVGRPDPEWGEAVTAYVVVTGDASDGELIDHCRRLLAGHKVPKAIHRLDALPRGPAGKVLRGALLLTG
jgi:o-succinylbenzoate---CoA ligase